MIPAYPNTSATFTCMDSFSLSNGKTSVEFQCNNNGQWLSKGEEWTDGNIPSCLGDYKLNIFKYS